MPRPKRSQRKREALLDLGVELLRSRGFHNTGLQELVDQVGVPKGSFYSYFPSKVAFGAAVVRRYAEVFEEELAKLREAGQESPRRALLQFFEQLMERFTANGARGGCLVGNLGAELDGEEPAISRALRETMVSWRETFAEIIELAQARGEISAARPAALLADFLINAWEGALIRMKIQDDVSPLAECIQIVFDDLLGGPSGGSS